MNTKLMHYENFAGSIEKDIKSQYFHGKLLDINGDLVTYEAKTIEKLEEEFKAAVNDYLITWDVLKKQISKAI